MPRTLPWLTGGTSRKEAPRKAQSEKSTRKRSSSPGDLVNSDLEPIGSSSPQHKPKKRAHCEPSSSPPPSARVAPLVEYMREGFSMDDRYRMVEDEFTTTARLFSLPLHQDEYERTRRRAKARGAETLMMIGHGTDGSTVQSRAMRLEMERKKRDIEDSDGEENVEEIMADPQLGGLMTASQSTPRKSLRSFARDSQRTPRVTGERTRDGEDYERVYKKPSISAIEEDEETDDEDEDDLDVFAPRKSTANMSVKPAARSAEKKPTPEPVKKPGIFKQFTNASQAERDAKSKKPELPKPISPIRSSLPRDSSTSAARCRSSPDQTACRDSTTAVSQPVKMSKAAAIIAKRREAEKRAKEEQHSPDKQIKQEMASQVRIKEEPVSQIQGRQIKREPSPSPVRQALASKSMAQRRAERAKKEADEKQKSKIDDIPTFLY